MKPGRTWIFVAALAVALTRGAPLRAQPTAAPAVVGGDDRPWNRGVAAETRQAARDLFLEGNRLFRVPLFMQAAEKYTAAIARWRHPAFYFNLAVTQLNLGQELEARANLEQALKHGAEPLGSDEYREAEKQLRDVERQLGRIHITCQTVGAEVTLDGAPVFVGPGSYQGWVKATAHEVTARKQGYLAEARRVAVAHGAVAETDLKLVTLDEATDTSRRWATWKPWTVVAGGVAVAAAAGGLHALSSHNFNSYDARFALLPCAQDHGCRPDQISPELGRELDRARLEQRIAIGGYIAGGAVIAAGAVLLYLNRPRLEPGARPGDGVAILPSISHDAIGLVLAVQR